MANKGKVLKVAKRINGKFAGSENYDSYAAAAKANGIPYMTFYMRLRKGWTPVKACSTPVRPYVKKVTQDVFATATDNTAVDFITAIETTPDMAAAAV